jgi:TonB family protein
MVFHETEAPMKIAEVGNAWEGRILDARLPLRQWLGSSDHSCVYLTELAGPQSPKAVVKMFPTNFFDLDHQLARWKAATQLTSPSLLRLLDGGRSEIDGTPFFFVVTDYAEEDLSQVLPHRPLTVDEVKQLLPPVLEGLTYLHNKGFVHGHIQPSNIMASGDKLKLPVERIYAIGELRDPTSPPTPYDAPEITKGPMTPAADVWSLGMFLIAALKQRPLAIPVNPAVAPLIPSDIPEPLRSIVGDCLTLDPKSRCTVAEIGAWLDPVPTPASSSVKPSPAQTSPVRIAEVSTKPAAKSADAKTTDVKKIDAKTTGTTNTETKSSGWRIGAPIAAVVLIGALVLGQRVLSHKTEPPKAQTQPAAATPVESPAPDAAVLHQVIPEVSVGTRRKIHSQINVGVQVEVDTTGKVTAANVVSPSSSHYFTNLAVKTAQQWEFSPAQNNGQPAPSAWLLTFQFAKRSTQVVPSRVK